MSHSNIVRKLNNADALPNIIYSADGSPVRKVCFSFEYDDLTAEQNITESLLGYVIRIGKIESWQFRSSATCTNGNIQFEQPEHATQLLNQSGREFAGAIVHFWNYSNMLSLPDKCLQEIFRNLDFNDLVSVAQVNERFKQNAKSIFSLKFGSFNMRISSSLDSRKKWMSDIKRLEKFLPIFGEFVVEMKFEYDAIDSSSINRVMELFALHCSDFKTLCLESFHWEDSLVSTIEPLLAKLTSLEIFLGEVSNRFIESLIHCCELNRLLIKNTAGDFQSFEFTLPKLETIEFESVTGLNQQRMERFLRQNTDLKNVILHLRAPLGPIFSFIGQYLPLVEKLSFSCTNFIDQPTFSRSAFASLKKLDIICYGSGSASTTINALAAAKAPLEFLRLLCSPDDQLINGISELKTIKTLMLCNKYSITRLLRIIDNLKELRYFGTNYLQANDLVRIVESAKKLEKLNLLETDKKITTETCAALVEKIKNRSVNRHLMIIIEKFNRPSNPNPTHREFLTFSEEEEDF